MNDIIQPSTAQPEAWPEGFITSTELDMVVLPDIKFTVEGILPMGLSMLVAKPKAGKSFMRLQLALATAHGDTFIGHATKQGDVLYYALEDHHRRLQQRERQLRESHTSSDNLIYSTKAPRIGAGLAEQIDMWTERVRAPSLVIIDTMGRVMPPAPPGSQEYNHATQTLGELQQLAFSRELSVLLIHHSKKAQKGQEVTDPFEQFLGSQAVLGVLDVMLVLDRPRMTNQAELSVTGRDVQEFSLPLTFDKGTGIWSSVNPNPQQELGLTPERFQVVEMIGRGVRKTGDIAIELDTSPSNVSNKLENLETDGFVQKAKHGVWALTPSTEEVLARHSENSEYGEDVANNLVQEPNLASPPKVKVA